jgi:DDE superfamily endonuclease
VVGLSLNPPAHAIVLCVDEKSQIQALEPTQPSRPVRPGLAKHPQVHLHFTPTYASWLNLVEVLFAILERQALRRGDFASVAELVAAIGRFCQGWNQRCQPFTWTKDVDQILATLNGGNTTATSDPNGSLSRRCRTVRPQCGGGRQKGRS